MPSNTVIPFDVIFDLFSYLSDRGDMSRLMRTCKTVHRHGIPALLRDTIDVYHKNLITLCRFFKADMSRCAHLRQLLVRDLNDASKMGIQFFARVLQKATNIRHLHIGEDALTNRDLRTALSNMKSIQELKLSFWDDEAASFLTHTQSPVRRLQVHCLPPDEWAIDSYADILQHLASLQNELEELIVQWGSLCEVPEGLRFPKVHTLHIYGCDAVEIRPIIVAFPNVRQLTIMGDEEIDALELSVNVDNIRTQNIRQRYSGGV